MREEFCSLAYVRAVYLSHMMPGKNETETTCNFKKICIFNIALMVKRGKIHLGSICPKYQSRKPQQIETGAGHTKKD